jgi:hypothetical protein
VSDGLDRAVAALVAATACGCASLPSAPSPVRGPLPARIVHPLALTVPSLGLRRAELARPGEVEGGFDVAYASIYESAQQGGDVVLFDGELTRASARIRAGLSERIEIEAELAGLYGAGGFLDGFIADFHDFFGFPNSGREEVEDGQSDFRVVSDGETLYSLEPHEPGLGDLPVTLSFALGPLDDPTTFHALRAVVELPTGSEERGFGNGGYDFGLGYCAETTSGAFSHFVAASWIHPHDIDAFDAPFAFSELFELGYALEVRFAAGWSGVAQIEALSPLTDDLPYEEIDEPMLDLALGTWRDLGEGTRAFVSFHEDPLSSSGPDFAVAAGVGFGR